VAGEWQWIIEKGSTDKVIQILLGKKLIGIVYLALSIMKQNLLRLIVIESIYSFYLNLTIIFGVIFFYQLSGSIILALLPYALGYLEYVLLAPFISKVVGKLGTRLGLIVAMLLFIISAIPIYQFQLTNDYVYVAVWFGLFFFAKTWYHPSITLLYSKITSFEHRGSELAYKQLLNVPIIVLTPFIGGLVMSSFGFSGITLLGGGLMLLAIVPVALLPNYYYDLLLYNLPVLLAKKHIRDMFSISFLTDFLAAAMRLWPIYIFIILSSSYIQLGGILAFTTAISMLLAYAIGKILDRSNRLQVFKTSVLFYALQWLLKPLALTTGMVVLADIAERLTKLLQVQSLDSIQNDFINANLQEESRDEVVIVRELATNMGIVSGIFAFAISAQFLGFVVTFIFAAFLGVLAYICMKYMLVEQ